MLESSRNYHLNRGNLSFIMLSSFRDIDRHPFFLLRNRITEESVTELLVNISYIYNFVYSQKTFAHRHLFTELRTFYGIKISIIVKKLQPSEN